MGSFFIASYRLLLYTSSRETNMRITWTGLGYLGFMIPLAFWAIAARFWGIPNYNAARIALALAAVTVWIVGKILNGASQRVGRPAPHQAFGYSMQWSGALLSIAGIVLTFL